MIAASVTIILLLATVGMGVLAWVAGYLWGWILTGTGLLMSAFSATFWKQSINEKKERTGK